MFYYKKIFPPMIYTTFFSFSTNKTEAPFANYRYTQRPKSFSYLLTAVYSINPCVWMNISSLKFCPFSFLFFFYISFKRRFHFVFLIVKKKAFEGFERISKQQKERGTMVKNRKKHRQNSHLIIHFPTSEGVSEVSERANE